MGSRARHTLLSHLGSTHAAQRKRHLLLLGNGLREMGQTDRTMMWAEPRYPRHMYLSGETHDPQTSIEAGSISSALRPYGMTMGFVSSLSSPLPTSALATSLGAAMVSGRPHALGTQPPRQIKSALPPNPAAEFSAPTSTQDLNTARRTRVECQSRGRRLQCLLGGSLRGSLENVS